MKMESTNFLQKNVAVVCNLLFNKYLLNQNNLIILHLSTYSELTLTARDYL